MKRYPRLRVYKVIPDCDCQRCQIELPWRVQMVHWNDDTTGFVEFESISVESCWDHVRYRLNRKPTRQRLTLTLGKKT